MLSPAIALPTGSETRRIETDGSIVRGLGVRYKKGSGRYTRFVVFACSARLAGFAEPRTTRSAWKSRTNRKPGKMRKVCGQWPSPAGEEKRTAPACLDQGGDEAGEGRPLWQSHARKRNTADLLV